MIIPFYKIPKNSNMIIYGCGRNGKEIFRRLIQSGYCNLVGWVDQDTSIGIYKGIDIEPPTVIRHNNFDYILISNGSQSAVEEIRAELISWGVDTKSIVCVIDEADFSLENDFWNENILINYIDNAYSERRNVAKWPEEYFPEINQMVKLHGCSYVEFLKRHVLLKINAHSRIILGILFYHKDFFDDEIMRGIMTDMLELDWRDDTFYGLIMDSMIMSFLKPNSLYREFYLHRRQLMRKLCKYYELDKIPLKYRGKKNKIAIIARRYTPQNLYDAPSRLVRDYALTFHEMGYEVNVYVLCAEIGASEKDIFVANQRMKVDNCVFMDEKIKNMKNIHLVILDDSNIGNRMRFMMAHIQETQPYFIFDMSAESFVEGYELIKEFPIVHYPMRTNDFSSCASLSLYPDKAAFLSLSGQYVGLEEINPYFISLNTMGKIKKENVQYSRKCFGLNEDDFVVVSVGARLNEEINQPLLEEMIQKLNENPKMRWILVGQSVERDNENFKKLVETRRIINWGKEEHLRSLYSISDVYLNPNRIGGAVSIEMAILEGVPVVMLDNGSDATAYIKEEYLVKGTERELVGQIQLLCQDKKKYYEVRHSFVKECSIEPFEKSVKRILKICRQEAEKCLKQCE